MGVVYHSGVDDCSTGTATLSYDKKIHVTTQTQNFSLYYVAMDIVAKETCTSNCSYRCYSAIFFPALLMVILHPVITETVKSF